MIMLGFYRIIIYYQFIAAVLYLLRSQYPYYFNVSRLLFINHFGGLATTNESR